MHILAFEAENYQRLRIVEIKPKSRLIQITGGNGQGKTSVLDALWAVFRGKYGISQKPVRHGAKESIIRAMLGDAKTGKMELTLERTIKADRTTAIKVTAADGTKFGDPQAMLNALYSELAFDPLQFLSQDTDEQIATLRKAAKVEYDYEAAATASAEDATKRTEVNREIKRLKIEVAAITVQDGLPKKKIDDAAILTKIQETDAINQQARKIDDAKRNAQRALEEAKVATTTKKAHRHQIRERKSDLERQLAEVEKQLKKMDAEIAPLEKSEGKLQAEVDAMPSGQYADVIKLTEQLQTAQTTNREIDRRDKRDRLEAELEAKKREEATLTRNLEKRGEAEAAAVAKAKMPVEGLTFDAKLVYLDGIPINQLGEAEQLRVSTLIAMSANPDLRVLRIMHGEALDDKNREVLEKLAEEHDFQIWMARVDTTGENGIIMEDGEVKADKSEAEAAQ